MSLRDEKLSSDYALIELLNYWLEFHANSKTHNGSHQAVNHILHGIDTCRLLFAALAILSRPQLISLEQYEKQDVCTKEKGKRAIRNKGFIRVIRYHLSQPSDIIVYLYNIIRAILSRY